MLATQFGRERRGRSYMQVDHVTHPSRVNRQTGTCRVTFRRPAGAQNGPAVLVQGTFRPPTCQTCQSVLHTSWNWAFLAMATYSPGWNVLEQADCASSRRASRCLKVCCHPGKHRHLILLVVLHGSRLVMSQAIMRNGKRRGLKQSNTAAVHRHRDKMKPEKGL